MTKQTLPARLIAHAECHESQPELMSDPEQRQWAADLREAAELLPELLEALNDCLTAMTALHCGEVSRAAIVAAARAAIAKANRSDA